MPTPESPLLIARAVAGVALVVFALNMTARWIAHKLEKRDKQRGAK